MTQIKPPAQIKPLDRAFALPVGEGDIPELNIFGEFRFGFLS